MSIESIANGGLSRGVAQASVLKDCSLQILSCGENRYFVSEQSESGAVML